MEEGKLPSSLRGLEVCPKRKKQEMGVAGGKQHTLRKVREPKNPVLSADPSSSERGLPFWARSPHSCSPWQRSEPE